MASGAKRGDIVAIDYLQTRPEINAKRVGMLGYSMGGTQTFLLTAVEPRIKVAIACAVPADTEKLSLVAPQNYARGIAGRPFLMLMGQNDPLCSVEQARQLYAFIESPHTAIEFFGGTGLAWYMEPKYWYVILPLANL